MNGPHRFPTPVEITVRRAELHTELAGLLQAAAFSSREPPIHTLAEVRHRIACLNELAGMLTWAGPTSPGTLL